MTRKKAIIIGVITFLVVGAIIGLIVGLYFRFRPSATPLYTSISSTSDDFNFLSSKLHYVNKNLFDDDINETVSIMFTGGLIG